MLMQLDLDQRSALILGALSTFLVAKTCPLAPPVSEGPVNPWPVRPIILTTVALPPVPECGP